MDPRTNLTIAVDHLPGSSPGTGLVVRLTNRDATAYDVTIRDESYGAPLRHLALVAKGRASATIDLAATQGWYDFTVVAGALAYRYAGRVETGAWSITDPAMARGLAPASGGVGSRTPLRGPIGRVRYPDIPWWDRTQPPREPTSEKIVVAGRSRSFCNARGRVVYQSQGTLGPDGRARRARGGYPPLLQGRCGLHAGDDRAPCAGAHHGRDGPYAWSQHTGAALLQEGHRSRSATKSLR